MGSIGTISEAASLAFHSMGLLAKRGNQVTTKEIAQTTGQSHAHLSKVLQRLVKAGLVRSTTGPHGGFVLAKPADQITLLEIYEAIEGPIEVPKCLLGRKRCLFGTCILEDSLTKLTEEFRDFLAGKRLSDVA